MTEGERLKRALDSAYGETPEVFHQRVQDTLSGLRAKERMERPVMKRKIRWGAVLLAALLLASAVGVAVNMNHVFAFITETAAKNWVLDEASGMLHENAARTTFGDCAISIPEWVCDGERLYVCVSIVDPALETEGHYVPEDEDEDYLGGLNHYGLRYGPVDVRLSEGTTEGHAWDYKWGDEENNEILYVFEQPLEGVPDEFTVTVPIKCSADVAELSFSVTKADFGRVRDFEPSAVTQADGYTAQITRFRATALRSYGELTLVFEESMPKERRQEIASDYMDGLGVPEGRLDAVAGEGEEILLAHVANWSADGLTCVIEMDGNPWESFPETVVYCPRWGMYDYDWDNQEGDMPALSMDGAVVMAMREVE